MDFSSSSIFSSKVEIRSLFYISRRSLWLFRLSRLKVISANFASRPKMIEYFCLIYCFDNEDYFFKSVISSLSCVLSLKGLIIFSKTVRSDEAVKLLLARSSIFFVKSLISLSFSLTYLLNSISCL